MSYHQTDSEPRLRPLYPAQAGMVLGRSEVLYVRPVPAVARPDAADRAVFPRLRGLPRVDDHRVVSGIVHVIRNGLMWKDAGAECAFWRASM